jgi:allophanate hydrolase
VAALAAGYAAGTTTPSAVVEDLLARLAGQDQPQAWITTLPARALRERAAELAALHASGDPGARPPLYGIPFAVKDNVDVAGLPTTVGCPDFTYHPTATATAVERLLAAGAILVGKTNLDQFATGLTGARSPYGACASVLDADLPSGGSSSGSAVAVAAGVVAFALGTDTAGSGRVPAALNGIVGLKPTRGLVSTAGVFPACRSLDCVSVFAPDAPDALAVLATVAGPDPADPWSRPLPRPEPRDPAGLRVGVARADDERLIPDAGQRAAYAAATRRVHHLVAAVDVVDLDPFLAAGDLLYDGPWLAERYAAVGSFVEVCPASVHPVTAAVLAPGRDVTGVAVFRGLHQLRELAAEAARTFRAVDVLLLPTVGATPTRTEVEADPFGTNAALGRLTQFANLLDLAVVAVPNGRTLAGRPAGLQVIGPAGSDATLARLGAALRLPRGAAPPPRAEPPVTAPQRQERR